MRMDRLVLVAIATAAIGYVVAQSSTKSADAAATNTSYELSSAVVGGGAYGNHTAIWLVDRANNRVIYCQTVFDTPATCAPVAIPQIQ